MRIGSIPSKRRGKTGGVGAAKVTDSDIRAALIEPRFAPRTEPAPIPSEAWNETPTRTLTVNSAWVSHILGALEVLDQDDTWQGSDDEREAARQQVREMIVQLSRETHVITDIRTVAGQLQIQRDGVDSWEAVEDANYVRVDGSVGMTDQLAIETQQKTGLDVFRNAAADVEIALRSAANADADYSMLLLASDRSLRLRNRSTGWDTLIINPNVTGVSLSIASGAMVARKLDTNNANKSAIFDWQRDGGSPAANYGMMQRFRMANAAGTVMTAAALETYWDDPASTQQKVSQRLTLTDQAATREIWHAQADHAKALLGVLGAAPSGRITVTGSKGGNAALASLLTAMATFGWITDSTT